MIFEWRIHSVCIDQNFGTLDLSGSASDLSTDQSSTGAKQMEIMLKLSSNFIDYNESLIS